MIPDLNEVMKKLIPKEVEVQDAKGDWYNMRIMPYRTTDNRIDGAVLTFTHIGDQKKTQNVLKTTIGEIEKDWELVRTIFDMNNDPLGVVDENGRIAIANKALSGFMHISPSEIEGINMLDQQPFVFDTGDLKLKLKNALKHGKNFKTRAFEVKSSKGKQRFFINGRILGTTENSTCRIFLQFVEH